MDEYKKIIRSFLENIEKVDLNCNLDNMKERDIYLLNVITTCRNKLMETYNCIGDDGWELPTLKWY
ncbi:MAG: hypothetical protein NC489_36700 [Ruminococcus flavefaciens]|nr:hypothetical protein [Ruminococcus flavefaciens]